MKIQNHASNVCSLKTMLENLYVVSQAVKCFNPFFLFWFIRHWRIITSKRELDMHCTYGLHCFRCSIEIDLLWKEELLIIVIIRVLPVPCQIPLSSVTLTFEPKCQISMPETLSCRHHSDSSQTWTAYGSVIHTEQQLLSWFMHFLTLHWSSTDRKQMVYRRKCVPGLCISALESCFLLSVPPQNVGALKFFTVP